MSTNYIGTGIEYPLRIEAGTTKLFSGVNVLDRSIITILTTPKGSVFYNRSFGSRLYEIQFEPNDDIVKNLLHYLINEALEQWEKRIKFVDVVFRSVTRDSVTCVIVYRLLTTNEIQELVYPFYRKAA